MSWLPLRRLPMRLQTMLGLWRLQLRRLLLVLGLLPRVLNQKNATLTQVNAGHTEPGLARSGSPVLFA
jgi:hypothetical protein